MESTLGTDTVAYRVKKNITGVYALVHKSTGMLYVGGSGYCIYNRIRHHFVMLRQGKHSTPKLQALWGEGKHHDFIQVLLEECPKSEVHAAEAAWILAFKPYLLNGSPDAARKRWRDPKYRASVTEAARLDAFKRHAAGTFGQSIWTEESRRKWRVAIETRKCK